MKRSELCFLVALILVAPHMSSIYANGMGALMAVAGWIAVWTER